MISNEIFILKPIKYVERKIHSNQKDIGNIEGLIDQLCQY